MKKLLFSGLSVVVIASLAFGSALSASSQEQTELARSAFRGDIEAVRKLTESGADPTASSVIKLAAKAGSMEVVRFLLKHGANPQDGLYSAFSMGHAEVAELLLMRGAEIDYERPGTQVKSSTILLSSIRNSNLEAVRQIVNYGADVNKIAAKGDTPLLQALMSPGQNQKEIIRFLISRGADPELKNPSGMSPRLFAKYAPDHLGLKNMLEISGDAVAVKPIYEAYDISRLNKAHIASHVEMDGARLLERRPRDTRQGMLMREGPSACKARRRFLVHTGKFDAFEVALCHSGPFSERDFPDYLEMMQADLNQMAQTGVELNDMFEVHSFKGRADTKGYVFMNMAVGHGVALLPTALIIDPTTHISLVVQVEDPDAEGDFFLTGRPLTDGHQESMQRLILDIWDRVRVSDIQSQN